MRDWKKDDTVQVYTFDVSARVNGHLDKAKREAAAGKPYVIQLAVQSFGWMEQAYISGFLEFWQKLGGQIGKRVTPIPVPDEIAGEIWNRAIAVRPDVVKNVTPVDMNIVFQTVTLPPDKQFDLVIGTK